MGRRVATVTRGRDQRRHGIGKGGHHLLPEKIRRQIVTLDGVVGTTTKRGREQRKMNMNMPVKEEMKWTKKKKGKIKREDFSVHRGQHDSIRPKSEDHAGP